jgi:hypothetical protein
MTRSGMSGWAKKNQCHHCVANSVVTRDRCSGSHRHNCLLRRGEFRTLHDSHP